MVHQEFEHQEKTTKQNKTKNKSKDHIKLTTNGNMIEDVQKPTIF